MKTKPNKIGRKIIACLLTGFFLGQNIAWAVSFDLSFMANRPQLYLSYAYSLNPSAFNSAVAKSVHRSLKPLVRKQPALKQIRLNKDLTIDSRIVLTPEELKSLYQWLEKPQTETVPCSAWVLYHLLEREGKRARIEEVSSLLILIDVLTGNINPKTDLNSTYFYNSFYSLQKTAQYFGLNLVPVELSTIDYRQLVNSLPFIAHLYPRHFILVTRIANDQVHFLYDKGETVLSLSEFGQDWTGYALIPAIRYQPSAISLLSDAEAQSILGAKRTYKGNYADLSKLFQKPSNTDLYISVGIAAASAGFGYLANTGVMGGKIQGFFGSNKGFFADFASGLATAEISKSATYVGIRNLGMNQNTAQIFGYAAGAGISGAVSGLAGGGWQAPQDWLKTNNFLTKHPVISGFGLGMFKGAAIGGGSLLGYKVMQNTSFYDKNPYMAKQIGSFLGAAAGYMGFTGLVSLAGLSQKITTTVSEKKGTKTAFGRNVTKFDGYSKMNDAQTQITFTPSTFGQRMSLAWLDMRGGFISQGASLGAEYILSDVIGIDMKYSRMLGGSIGTLASYKFGNQTLGQTLIKGAISGGISFGLNALGGDVDKKTGKNRFGLTDLQMAGVTWLGSSLALSGYDKLKGGQFWSTFAKSTNNLFTDYMGFGGDGPFASGGAGGWREVRYIQKMAEWGGYANLAANADYAMKVSGYKSWGKFVKDGKAANLFPSISNSLVRYTASTLHYSAVDNIMDTLSAGSMTIVTKDKAKKTVTFKSKQREGLLSGLGKKMGVKSNSWVGESLFLMDPNYKSGQVIETLIYSGKGKNFKPYQGEIPQLVSLPQSVSSAPDDRVYKDKANTVEQAKPDDLSSSDTADAQKLELEVELKKLPYLINETNSHRKILTIPNGSMGEMLEEKEGPVIKSEYNPKKNKYYITTSEGEDFYVDRVVDVVRVGDVDRVRALKRVMEDGHTVFPEIKNAPNYIPSENEILSTTFFAQGVSESLLSKDVIVRKALPSGKSYDQQAKAVLDLPGYDEKIEGRMIYGNSKDPARLVMMSKLRKDGDVEFNFQGGYGNDPFNLDGVEVKDGRFIISEGLSPTGNEIVADKIKWNRDKIQPSQVKGESWSDWPLGAHAAESFPDGRLSTTETVVKDGEIGITWENKTTVYLDVRIYAKKGEKVFYIKAQGDKLMVSKNEEYTNSIEVDKAIGLSFGDVRAEKGREFLDYRPSLGDTIGYENGQLKVHSERGGYIRTDVIEGVDGLDMESLEYINRNVIMIQDNAQNGVYFKDGITGSLGVEAPKALYNNKDVDLDSYTALYIVDKDKKLQPHISVESKNGVTKTYHPVSDFKGLIPEVIKYQGSQTSNVQSQDWLTNTEAEKAIGRRISYKLYAGSNFPPADLEGLGLEKFYERQQNNNYQTSTSQGLSSSTLKFAEAGIGAGGTGNKNIEGYSIINEPNTMTLMNDFVISENHYGSPQTTDLNKLSDAQYTDLMNNIENSGKSTPAPDTATMVQDALSPLQMLKNYGIGRGSLIAGAQPSALGAEVVPNNPSEWTRQQIEFGSDGKKVERVARFDENDKMVFNYVNKNDGEKRLYGQGYKDGNYSGKTVSMHSRTSPGEKLIRTSIGETVVTEHEYQDRETGKLQKVRQESSVDTATGLNQVITIENGDRTIQRFKGEGPEAEEVFMFKNNNVKGYDAGGNKVEANRYFDKRGNTIIDTDVTSSAGVEDTDDYFKKRTTEYFDKGSGKKFREESTKTAITGNGTYKEVENIVKGRDVATGLNQVISNKSTGEQSIRRYDDKGELVFGLNKQYGGDVVNIIGHNKNGQMVTLDKKLDNVGNTVLTSGYDIKGGYEIKETRYDQDTGKKINETIEKFLPKASSSSPISSNTTPIISEQDSKISENKQKPVLSQPDIGSVKRPDYIDDVAAKKDVDFYDNKLINLTLESHGAMPLSETSPSKILAESGARVIVPTDKGDVFNSVKGRGNGEYRLDQENLSTGIKRQTTYEERPLSQDDIDSMQPYLNRFGKSVKKVEIIIPPEVSTRVEINLDETVLINNISTNPAKATFKKIGELTRTTYLPLLSPESGLSDILLSHVTGAGRYTMDASPGVDIYKQNLIGGDITSYHRFSGDNRGE